MSWPGTQGEPNDDHVSKTCVVTSGLDMQSKPHDADVGQNRTYSVGSRGGLEENSSCPRCAQFFNMFMGAVIILNIAVMIIEADSRSLCDDGDECTDTSRLMHTLNTVFLAIYSAELVGRLFIERWDYFKNGFNLLDILIVVVGILDIFMHLPNLQMLRLFRLVRISRIAKLLRSFPMLEKLFRGVVAAAIATLWGYLLIVLFLMVWSLIAVEVIQPVNRKLDYPEGDWCGEAFESVVKSSLYFYQTLIAGDAWGTCSIPIMRAAPYTYFVFIGAEVSVSIGFMNLILAVIVDSASSMNAANEEALIEEKAKRTLAFTSKLREALQKVDSDKSGCISWDEMLLGYHTEPSVEHTFNLLDIEETDLEVFFDITNVESKEEHSISYARFVGELEKAQLQDPRIYMMMMKLHIQKITTMLQEITLRPGLDTACLRGGPALGASSASGPGLDAPRLRGGPDLGAAGASGDSAAVPAPGDGRSRLDASLQSGLELDSIWRSLESRIESRLKEMAREIVGYAAGHQKDSCSV